MSESSGIPRDARRGQGRRNPDRSAAMAGELLAAARALFVAKGYGETSTPEIAAAAGVTRGALYHHFADKLALFRAVIVAENAQVAAEIEAAAMADLDPMTALVLGAGAYCEAMRDPGRCRLLLLEGPAVLGLAEMAAIDAAHGGRTLREGLAALNSGLPADLLGEILSGAFDRAALMVSQGADVAQVQRALARLLAGLKR